MRQEAEKESGWQKRWMERSKMIESKKSKAQEGGKMWQMKRCKRSAPWQSQTCMKKMRDPVKQSVLAATHRWLCFGCFLIVLFWASNEVVLKAYYCNSRWSQRINSLCALGFIDFFFPLSSIIIGGTRVCAVHCLCSLASLMNALKAMWIKFNCCTHRSHRLIFHMKISHIM